MSGYTLINLVISELEKWLLSTQERAITPKWVNEIKHGWYTVCM